MMHSRSALPNALARARFGQFPRSASANSNWVSQEGSEIVPIKSLLIASDLSERSDRAIQRGFMLAAEMGARATVVSIVDDSLPEELIAELERRSRDLLHATASSLAGNVEFEIIVRRGDAISQLVEIVNSGGFDMAVVGIHRSRGVFDGLRPTTVESVVSQSLRPILLVAAPAHAAYGRVLAPVGFSPACQRAVEVSLCLAPKAAFRLFHAWMAPFEGLTGGRPRISRGPSSVRRQRRRRPGPQACPHRWQKSI